MHAVSQLAQPVLLAIRRCTKTSSHHLHPIPSPSPSPLLLPLIPSHHVLDLLQSHLLRTASSSIIVASVIIILSSLKAFPTSGGLLCLPNTTLLPATLATAAESTAPVSNNNHLFCHLLSASPALCPLLPLSPPDPLVLGCRDWIASAS